MKIYFHEISNHNNNTTTYVYSLLKYLARQNGHEISSLEDCDIAAISLSHYSYIQELIKLRKMTKKKIIIGGHISHSPYALLAFADYVNLGHGFEFFEKVKSVDDLEEFDFIISKRKLDGKISQYINWDAVPIIQISKNLYSYLWSVGCKNKCKFCLTSWMNQYQVNPHKGILMKLKMKFQNKKLSIISNDYSDSDVARPAANVLINNLIREPSKFQNIGLIRFGIESPSYETRRFLGKKNP